MPEERLFRGPAPAVAPPAPPLDSRRWWILVIIGVAQLMVTLDTSIVNIALPSAQADLGFSDGSRQWIITAYALAFASLLLLSGRLADLFGRKPALLIGAAGFATASILGGVSTSFGMLVAARALQGVFAALLAPAALSLLNTTFTDSRERAKAFGIFGAIGASGTVVGLLIGGALTQALDWRWTMFVNVLFSAVALFGGWKLLTNTRDAANSRLDLPGTVLISAGLFAVVFGLSNAESQHWDSPLTWGFLLAGVLLVAAFAWWQTRAEHPLLPLRILTDRNRAASFATLLLTGAGLFGVLLFLTYYLQLDLGFSPITTGLAFLPMIVLMMGVAQFSTMKLVPRSVNAMQQVGGSIGTALLNTLAAGAAAAFLVGKNPADPTARADAAIASYTTAFWWAAGLFAAGAVLTALLYRRKAVEPATAEAAPSPS
ncbi:MFS transporter [Amycolatopsis jiangsuensis]|uniref:MFS family permease n=1 Tax=Amycolatopsis jiangsuensis TaxID=1181879 RepID=A0A840IPB0_9PSEU|nr:MFS transporter [Amycolatopsis jiangsuensis]MBB4683780.1 MFS family permease [Amycolatopsis jiangsuensis]